MTARASSHLPLCGICNKPIKLETGKIDELGKAGSRGMLSAQNEFATSYHAPLH